MKLRPFGGYAAAGIAAGITAYLATRPGGADTKFKDVDLNIASRQTLYGGLHPGVWGHANIAALVIEQVIDTYNAVTGGGSGGGGGTATGINGSAILGIL